MVSPSRDSPVFPSPAWYPVSAGECALNEAVSVSSLKYLSFFFPFRDAPKVLMPAITNGYYLQNGAVRCQIESLIPFTLRFSSDGRRLGVDQFFR